MLLSELREAVRAQLDLDDTDLPNARIDLYLRDGFNRTIQMEQNWPFLQKEWSLTTTADDGSYAFSAIGSDVREIQAIDSLDFSFGMAHIEHELANRIWVGDYDTSGTPEFFSVHNETLHLWPKPVSTYDLTIRGIRKPTDWVASGAATEPDWDNDQLDISLVYFACSRSYLLQEDDDLAAVYDNLWKETVAAAKEAVMRPPATRPMVLNSGPQRPVPFRPFRLQGLV